MQKWKPKGDRKATTEIEGMIFTNSRKQIGRQSLKKKMISHALPAGKSTKYLRLSWWSSSKCFNYAPRKKRAKFSHLRPIHAKAKENKMD